VAVAEGGKVAGVVVPEARGEAALELLPRSPSPIFGSSRIVSSQKSGKASTNRRCFKFQAWLRAARVFLSWSVLATDPVVISSLSMKDKMPVQIVATLQAGFHVPGWKSDMEKQIFLSGWKRPEGVSILIPGGLNGYSAGNMIIP